MSTGLDDDGKRAETPAAFSEFDDEVAAGDWGLYQSRCAYVDDSAVLGTPDAVALKRRFCLVYLGTRAQARGGVYMRSRPSVFTPAFVDRLAAENAGRRFARYPWLERLIQLLQQLDQDQYQASPATVGISMAAKRLRLHVVPTTNSFA